MSVVVAVWKAKGGECEAYSSLSAFLRHNPGYKRDTVNHYLVRKKVPYETEDLKLTRCTIKTNS